MNGDSPAREFSLGRVVLALSFALFIAWWAELLRFDGRWYSNSLTFRLQTTALLQGHFALQPLPYQHEDNWAWGNGMQQVNGLGVPLVRLPFEWLARQAGFAGFRDSVVLIGFILASSVLIVCFLPYRGPEEADDWSRLRDLAAAVILIAHPPILTMMSGRLFAHEEVAAYGYYLVVTLAVICPHAARFSPLALSLFAFGCGATVLFRPTIGIYGATLFGIAMVLARRTARFGIPAAASFALPILFLFYTNAIRFGHPLEFGHNLNLSFPENDYGIKFTAPIGMVSISEAAGELLGALFRLSVLNGLDFFRCCFHPGQSAAPRFREYYFGTYDLIAPLIIVLAWLMWVFRPRSINRPRGTSVQFTIWSVVSIISTLTLFVFYLYAPCMASRYLTDFAPAFALALVCLVKWSEIYKWSARPAWLERSFGVVVLLIGLSWTASRLSLSRTADSHQRAQWYTHDEIESFRLGALHSGPPIPHKYFCGVKEGHADITFNVRGWRTDCSVVQFSILFFPPTRCVTYELEKTATLKEAHLAAIRAKIGREELTRVQLDDAGETIRMKFCATSTKPPFPSLPSVLFTGWVAPQHFDEPPPLRLLSVTSAGYPPAEEVQ